MILAERELKEKKARCRHYNDFALRELVPHLFDTIEDLQIKLKESVRVQTALNAAESVIDEPVVQGDHYALYTAPCPYAKDHKRVLHSVFKSLFVSSASKPEPILQSPHVCSSSCTLDD